MIAAPLTAEEFLRWENEQEEKHEYLDGEIVAMAGARPRHEDIVFPISGILYQHEERSDCRFYSGNTRVRAGRDYFYPDVVAACAPIFEDAPSFCLTNPRLIFEVLSPSTEDYDRGRKATAYRSIPSLRELALVRTDEPRIELYRRVEDGWLLVEFAGEDATLSLVSLGLDLPFRRIYARRIAAGWRDE